MGLVLVGTGFAGTNSANASPKSCANGGTCKVGDIGPGGGVVFFVKHPGAFHREASRSVDIDMVRSVIMQTQSLSVDLTSAQQSSLKFDYLEAAPSSGIGLTRWASSSGQILNASQFIGAGESTTKQLLSAYPNDNESNNAAHYAQSYTNNGFSDWFLPSMDELALITIEHVAGMLGANDPIGNIFYGWSTTDVAESSVVRIDSQTWAKRYNVTIYGTANVLPIRAFSKAVVPAKPVPPVVVKTHVNHRFAKSVYFADSSAVLTPTMRAKIRQVFNVGGRDATYVVTGVVGARMGVSDAYAKALGQMRARAIKNYLVKLGVKKSSIVMKHRIRTKVGVPRSSLSVTY